jgi:hypothetical protein
MRAFPILLAALLLPVATAVAQQPKAQAAAAKAEGPKAIGRFDDWTAATNPEGGQTVCYAFVRAGTSAPSLSGRGDVVLTVTQRPSGRDAVAISAGFAYPQGAAVTVQVDQNAVDFYASGRNAFARDNKAAVAALNRGRQVTARSPAPHAAAVVDTFSLKGFGRAYEAITKACPPK